MASTSSMTSVSWRGDVRRFHALMVLGSVVVNRSANQGKSSPGISCFVRFVRTAGAIIERRTGGGNRRRMELEPFQPLLVFEVGRGQSPRQMKAKSILVSKL